MTADVVYLDLSKAFDVASQGIPHERKSAGSLDKCTVCWVKRSGWMIGFKES